MISLKYSEISNFGFAQAVSKISQTPTHGEKASQIFKIVKKLNETKNTIAKAYQEHIVNVFGKRNEKGEIIRPDGEPMGFEPMEDKQEEFIKAQEAFGDTVVELDCAPFTVNLLSDMKISAADIEALRGLYFEGKPAVPDNVKNIR